MPKLTKVQELAAIQLHDSGKKAREIAKTIEAPINDVNEFLKSRPKKVVKKEDKTGFAKHSTTGKKIGAAIMTPTAAQRGDDFRERNPNNNSTPRESERIFIIDKEKNG